MPAVSVIIPVYNVAAYIADCIESLKQQRFRDLEFIFVDDCSPDDSMTFVEEFAAADPRARILRNEENIGLGRTKNRGIEAASGDFISIVDPDDWIAPDFYELLYAKAASGNFDIVKGIRIRVYRETGETEYEKSNEKIRKGLRKGVPLFYSFNAQHQTAIYKKSLFADKTVRFGTGRSDEDTTFLLIVCKKTGSIAFADEAAYYYSIRAGSLTASFSEQRCRNDLYSLREKVDFLVRGDMGQYEILYLEKYIAERICRICHGISCGMIPKDIEEELAEFMAGQLFRIPGWQQTQKNLCEILILSDYRKMIPERNIRPGTFHYDRVLRWTDLMAGHPEIGKRWILLRYVYALFQAPISMLVNAPDVFFRERGYFSFIRKQLGRLDPGQKRKLFWYVIPALYKSFNRLVYTFLFGGKYD